MGSFSIWHWLIVLVIVMLVFGTKKLKNIGSDLGGAVKGFKQGMKEGESFTEPTPGTTKLADPGVINPSETIDVESREKSSS